MGNSASSGGPRISNYTPGKVYLFTFPSVRCCPTFSPFALKVESWLRLNEIDYEAIRGFDHWSKKGQIPFVEVDGREINESSVIVKELADKFEKSDNLTEEQAALARMVEVMLDNHTMWSSGHYRMLSSEAPAYFELLASMGKVIQTIVSFTMPRRYRSRINDHGMGRNTDQEVYAMGCDDIRALSELLGDKKYLLGDQPNSVDCAVFGHLAQVWYFPLQSPHKVVIQNEAKNLGPYLDRLKELIWPDWDEFCASHLKPME